MFGRWRLWQENVSHQLLHAAAGADEQLLVESQRRVDGRGLQLQLSSVCAGTSKHTLTHTAAGSSRTELTWTERDLLRSSSSPGRDLLPAGPALTSHPARTRPLAAAESERGRPARGPRTALHTPLVSEDLTADGHSRSRRSDRGVGGGFTFVLSSNRLEPPRRLLAVSKPIKRLVLMMTSQIRDVLQFPRRSPGEDVSHPPQ